MFDKLAPKLTKGIAARFVDSSKNLVGVQISKTEWLVYNPKKVSNFLNRG
jgi:hypothetical protein